MKRILIIIIMLLCCIGCGSEVERIKYLNEKTEDNTIMFMIDSDEYITISGTTDISVVYYNFVGLFYNPMKYKAEEIKLLTN